MKINFLDTETTHRNPCIGELIELAMIIDTDDRKNLGKICLKFRPANFDAIDPEALKVNGTSIEELEAYPDRDESFLKLIEFLDKHVNKFDRDDKMYMVAHNLWFDHGFLRQLFDRYAAKYPDTKHYFYSYFHVEGFDTIPMMTHYKILFGKEYENMKLGTLCRALKIDIDETKTHSALYDAAILRKLFYKSDLIVEKFLSKYKD